MDGTMETAPAIFDGLVLRTLTVAERHVTAGSWPITVRIGTEVLVRSGPSGTAYFVADLI
jgi:hypothetical protein